MIHVSSTGTVTTGSILWMTARGGFASTLVCKVTFDLAPVACRVSERQEPVFDDDRAEDDKRSASLRPASDLAPFKLRADVLLVGKAFAPRGEPVRSLVARLRISEIDKGVEVHGDRAWTAEGEITAAAPFNSMPLAYERAAGGPGTGNPVGIAHDAAPDARGLVPVPNLMPPGLGPLKRREPIPPIGFGPIAPGWPERLEKLHRHAATWFQVPWTRRPIPDDFDATFFNAAPRDQQIGNLRDDQPIVLENLHTEHPRMTTALPGVRPRALCARAGGDPQDLPLRPDTLWIDTSRSIATMVWRGQVALDHPDQEVRVVVRVESAERALPALPAGVSEDRPVSIRKARAAPFAATTTDVTDDLSSHAAREVLPFSGGKPSAGTHEMQPVIIAPSSSPTALPFTSSPAPPALMIAPPAIAPPALIAPITPASPIAAPLPIAPATLDPPARAAAPRSARHEDTPARQVAPAKQDAAAPPRDVLRLLWFDPESVAALRALPGVAKSAAAKKPKPPASSSAGAPSPEPPKTRDQRDAFEIIAATPAEGPDGIARALRDAVGDHGMLTPPLVITGGDLAFSFDEVEALRAAVAVATPFVASDSKLREAVDAARSLLEAPERASLGPIAEGLSARVREAFAQSKRALSPGYLDAQTERILLEQRHYQRRTVFGQRWIRALLTPNGATEAIPAYLPDALAKHLPMFQRLDVKLAGELDIQQDPLEAHVLALRVVAIARVFPASRLR